MHQIRNSIRYASHKNTKKLLADLKPVYTAVSEQAGLDGFDEFERVRGTHYPLVAQSWQKNGPELSTFFKYPPEVRKIIYTTNMIES